MTIEMTNDDAESEVEGTEESEIKEDSDTKGPIHLNLHFKLTCSISGPRDTRTSRYRDSHWGVRNQGRGGKWGNTFGSNWGERRRQWKCWRDCPGHNLLR